SAPREHVSCERRRRTHTRRSQNRRSRMKGPTAAANPERSGQGYGQADTSVISMLDLIRAYRPSRTSTGRASANVLSMCLLIAMFGEVADAPLIMAANRDERLDRPAVPMTVLRDHGPRILGGRDELAGGTWLAVNEHGVVAGLTNRPS